MLKQATDTYFSLGCSLRPSNWDFELKYFGETEGGDDVGESEENLDLHKMSRILPALFN